MGLFDYDARPATPQVQLVGDRSAAAAYALRDFLTRNGLPYDWQEVQNLLEAPCRPGWSGAVRVCRADHTQRSAISPSRYGLSLRAVVRQLLIIDSMGLVTGR